MEIIAAIILVIIFSTFCYGCLILQFDKGLNVEWIKVKTTKDNIDKVIAHGVKLGYADTYSIKNIEQPYLYFNPFYKKVLWSDEDIFNSDENYITMTAEEFLSYRGDNIC